MNRIALFCFSLIFCISCQKDYINDTTLPEESILIDLKTISSWNEKERQFFNLSNTTSYSQVENPTGVRNSSESPAPLLTKVYNKLVEQNENDGFVEDLISEIGIPYWNKAILYMDKNAGYGVATIPVGFEDGRKTAALFVAAVLPENGNRIPIEIVTRTEIEAIMDGTVEKEARPNLKNELMYFQLADRFLYGNCDSSQRIKDFRCEIVDEDFTASMPGGDEPCGCELVTVQIVNNNGNDDPEEPGAGGEGNGNNGGGGSGGGGSNGNTYGGPFGQGGSDINWDDLPDWTGGNTTVIIIIIIIWNDEEDDGGGGPPCRPPDPDCDPLDPVFHDPNSNSSSRNDDNGDGFYYIMDCGGDGINSHDFINDSYNSVADATAIANDLGLTCDEIDCLIEHPKFFVKVRELLASTSLLCTEEDPNNLLREKLAQACMEGETYLDRLNMLEEFLDGVDKIDYGELEEKCKCFYDMMQLLINKDSDNWLCKALIKMEASSNFSQKFSISDSHVNISNSPDYNNGEATMLIPSSYCNDESGLTDLELGARFIHELLHGHLFNLLHDKYPEGYPEDFILWDGNIGIYNEDYWIELVREYNNISESQPVSGNHHVLFYEYLKDILLNAFHDLNDGIGEPSDYEYYVNVLINTEDLATSPWAVDLGLATTAPNGSLIVTFNNNDYLNAWNNIGGYDGFSLKCD